MICLKLATKQKEIMPIEKYRYNCISYIITFKIS